MVTRDLAKVETAGSSPVYRFCSTKKDIRKGCPFSLKEPHPGLKVRASSFHCGRRRAGVHWTPCAVYRFCSTKKDIRKGCPFFVERAPSGAQSSSVFVPLRSAQSRCPPDTLRRLSLRFNKKGKIKSQQRLDNHLTFMIAYKQILGSSSHQGYDVVLFVITPAGWIYIRG